eukprot:5324692-Amphidinium_carterae.2
MYGGAWHKDCNLNSGADAKALAWFLAEGKYYLYVLTIKLSLMILLPMHQQWSQPWSSGSRGYPPLLTQIESYPSKNRSKHVCFFQT